MPISSAVAALQTESALQQAKDNKARIEESFLTNRNVGNTMGKNDFLKLLSAQLQYQDPLEPMKDSDFAAQLAQFSSLEQMQNMNNTLLAMSNTYQAYNLIGRYVVADAFVDEVMTKISGVVDSVFTKDGVSYAMVSDYAVPIGTITDVADASVFATSKSFLEASSSLMGRYVRADMGDDKTVEGYVKRVTVEGAILYAYLEDSSGSTVGVPVERIYDVRQEAGAGEVAPESPPEQDAEDDGEHDPDIEP